MQSRSLVVVADDYGIGPNVSRGILELLRSGTVTSTVLLVNSPYAEDGIRLWKQSGRIGEMGWHPNLTMDRPVAPPDRVSTLLKERGQFAPLGTIAIRMATGRLSYHELVRELDAQFRRFCDLVGHPPTLINGHKHIHVFPMIGRALTEVLERWRVRPYVRRVVEPLTALRRVPGARIKRAFLSTLGRLAAKRQDRAGFAGNDCLAGITDPKWVHDPLFYSRWLSCIPGNVVELAVHPGYRDETLLGRDCTLTDGQLERRVAEMRLLTDRGYLEACQRAGFTLCTTARIGEKVGEVLSQAA